MENVKENIKSVVKEGVSDDSVFELQKVGVLTTGIIAFVVGAWAVTCIVSAFIHLSPAVVLSGLIGIL